MLMGIKRKKNLPSERYKRKMLKKNAHNKKFDEKHQFSDNTKCGEWSSCRQLLFTQWKEAWFQVVKRKEEKLFYKENYLHLAMRPVEFIHIFTLVFIYDVHTLS